MTKSKKTETTTATEHTPTEQDTRFADLAALFEALDTRVSAIEAAAAQSTQGERTATSAARSTAAKVAAEATGGATSETAFSPALGGAAMAPDVLAKYSELQDKRQRDAAARATGRSRKAVEPGRLEQLAREFEGANVTSARMRLQDLQTKGTISDFRVLPPGSAMPNDTNVNRILLTTDSHGFIISADVG